MNSGQFVQSWQIFGLPILGFASEFAVWPCTVADTDLVENVEEVEEQLQEESDGGVALEPFNLVQERRAGHFDEGGNYVEGKAEEEDTDAWLTSDGMPHMPCNIPVQSHGLHACI